MATKVDLALQNCCKSLPVLIVVRFSKTYHQNYPLLILTMATTKGNTITAMRKPLPKNVSRPVVVLKGYKGPSKEGAMEYNSNKRELKSLFSDFSADPQVVKMRRLTYKIGQLKAQTAALLKQACMNKPVRKEVSYASIALVGAIPTTKFSSVSVPKSKPMALVSRAAARRDYTAAFKRMQSEKASALALVKAIAARHPIIVRHQRDSISLVRASQLKEACRRLRRERRYLARHPAKEVAQFPVGCFESRVTCDFIPTSVFGRKQKPSPKVWNESSKQIKKRTPVSYFQTLKGVENSRFKEKKDTSSKLVGQDLKFLLFKLRMKILNFRNPHKVEWIFRSILNRPIPQMDTTGEIQETQSSIQPKSNVIIESSSTDEVGISHGVAEGFAHLSVSKQKQTFETFTDRWLFVKQVDWTTTQEVNTAIFQLNFPYEILRNHASSQMAQVLFTNRFFKFDMEFKIVLNSSPWQCGLLVADWCYGLLEDTKQWQNVYSAVQRNHAKLNAGSSNNVIIRVPYHNFNSYISNKTNQCSIGTLTCRVLNKLAVTDKVASKASISVFVSIQNIDAHGLIHREIGRNECTKPGIQGQMQNIGELCNAGSNLLRTAGNIFNQDKPPMPLQPMSLIPQTVPSFAYTDGITEPINVLRSDPRGQRVPAVRTSEMTLETLGRGWGFLKTFEWKFSHEPGTTLFTLNVAPLLDVGDYTSFKHEQPGIHAVVYPPVALLASMASKVRGNLDYRFEVVANSFYTGSLQISSIPLDDNSERSQEECMLSATQVMDICKTSVIDVSVPWNWYNAWMRSPSLFRDRGNHFAKLYVKVVNSLIAIDSVPTSVRVNVYMKGGDNFEVCQLRTPRLALDSGIIYPPSTEYLHPYNTETRWYLTWNRNIGGTNKYLQTPYIQNVTNGWVGYTGVQEYTVYYLANSLNNGNVSFRVLRADGKAIYYGVYHSGLATANAHGLVVFYSQDAAKYAVQMFKTKGYTPAAVDAIIAKFPDEAYQTDGPWSEIKRDGKNWIPADNKDGEYPIWTPSREFSDFEVIGQMDCEGVVITTEQQAPQTSYGLSVYGESMPDLKGIARRWQHYGSFVGKTCTAKYPRDCSYMIKLPVAPRRKINPVTSISYDNRLRDGSISLLNSAFAFWEGGMRYRIAVTHSVPQDTVVYVQHRFDDEDASVDGITPGQKLKSAKDMMDTHYPTFVQALSVNPVITVEVPYMRDRKSVV